jgi:putative Mg2+ transporter-C (MgtC) family protein
VIDTLDFGVRIAAAAGAGALVGLERESHGQQAGMRTNALVAVGACLFTLVGAYGFPEHVRGENVDPMRVAAQVVSGIGFIGAGVIIRDRGAIRGVTTAAALWVSAALGMAAAASLFGVAWIGLLATIVALVGLRVLRDRGVRRFTRSRHAIVATYQRGHGTLAPLIEAIEASGGQLESLRIDDEENSTRHVELDVRTRDGDELRDRVTELVNRPEVETIICP